VVQTKHKHSGSQGQAELIHATFDTMATNKNKL